MLSKKETSTLKIFWVKGVKRAGTHKRLWVKRTKVSARCLVKPTVVVNTRAWSFIVKKLQRKIVVISWVMHTQSLAWYEATEEANLLKKPLPGVDNGRQ
jgi:hypothetical protein